MYDLIIVDLDFRSKVYSNFSKCEAIEPLSIHFVDSRSRSRSGLENLDHHDMSIMDQAV